MNVLWPRTVIANAVLQNLLGGDEVIKGSRSPGIMPDAARVILTRPSREFSGYFCVDDEVLASVGVNDLSKYAMVPGAELILDFFV